MLRHALGALLVALALAPHPAAAQVRDTALMRGEIMQPLVVHNDADMDFGRIMPGTAPGTGTVVMTPSASATCTTNNGIIRTGTCRAARFEGDTSFLFLLRVTKPAGPITLTGPAGATMVLDNLTADISTAALTLSASGNEYRYLILTGGGNFTLYVGGTLHVARTQRPGVYNGTFTLSFNYD